MKADDEIPLSEGDVNVSAARRRWRAGLSEQARDALDADERYFLRQSLSTPCLTDIVRAEGAWLTDIDGRRYLDFHGNSVHQLGHGHPRVLAAMREAMERLPFCPRRYANSCATALARRLVETAPRALAKALFAPSGSAAIGMALKLARYATGRHRTLSFWDSFHGANLDAIGIGGEALFRRELGPLTPGAEHLPPLDSASRFFGEDRPYDKLADLIDYTLEVQGDVAALIAEPLRWTTVTAPPTEFWPRVRESCTRHGTLLVFDEIPSCLARSGALYACERLGATPDVLVIGKGLGGGVMPLAAILARADLDCAPDAALGHYTHEKSPVACAAGLAALDVIAEENLIARARELEARGAARLAAMMTRTPRIAKARSFGAYFGVEIGGPHAEELADRAMYACLTRGLSFKIGGGKVITLCPPLTMSLADFDSAFDILEQGLGEAGNVRG